MRGPTRRLYIGFLLTSEGMKTRLVCFRKVLAHFLIARSLRRLSMCVVLGYCIGSRSCLLFRSRRELSLRRISRFQRGPIPRPSPRSMRPITSSMVYTRASSPTSKVVLAHASPSAPEGVCLTPPLSFQEGGQVHPSSLASRGDQAYTSFPEQYGDQAHDLSPALDGASRPRFGFSTRRNVGQRLIFISREG